MRVSLLLISSVFTVIKADIANKDFDADYYFSSSLRSTESCDQLSKMYCQVNCGKKNGVCIGGRCFCFSIKEVKHDTFIQKPNKPEESLTYALRPTLRHHIAHFCPNLEAARTCIRKCMVEGKPAFCGKDHVCYCGHKYKNTDVDPTTNPEDIYNQFKDLYAKYFGPEVNSKKGVSDDTEI